MRHQNTVLDSSIHSLDDYEAPEVLALPNLKTFELIDHRDPPLNTAPMLLLLGRLEANGLETLVLSLRATRRKSEDRFSGPVEEKPAVFLGELRTLDEGLGVLIRERRFPLLSSVPLKAICRLEDQHWSAHEFEESMPWLGERGYLKVDHDACFPYVVR